MNFLALFIGLAIERLLTQVFHWREFRWLDPAFDLLLRNFKNSSFGLGMLAAFAGTALIALPVWFVETGLQGRLAQIPLFAFAVVVLLFCLGPRDLGEEIDEYRSALANGDEREIRRSVTGLLQTGSSGLESAAAIEEAIYAKANNRIFAVVFWFALLGPTAAWFFRVLDLMRRRAIFFYEENAHGDSGAPPPHVVRAVLGLHRLIAWVPARLLMLGYALAGSFDGAITAWRKGLDYRPGFFPGPDDRLLGAIGRGAAPVSEENDVATRAGVALRFVVRVLWMIWCPTLALLTLYGWIL